jgi:hypothetical protein
MRTLPVLQFSRTAQVGVIDLLGAIVPVFTEDPTAPLNAALLYQFECGQFASPPTWIYVGQATGGIGRPVEDYGKVLADLRENRKQGCKVPASQTVASLPAIHYRNDDDPWGFRWVHHELERWTFNAVHGIKSGELAICIRPLGMRLTRSQVGKAETAQIVAWHTSVPGVSINGMPAMARAARSSLDACWQ